MEKRRRCANPLCHKLILGEDPFCKPCRKAGYRKEPRRTLKDEDIRMLGLSFSPYIQTRERI
jgi:hypothetical protein